MPGDTFPEHAPVPCLAGDPRASGLASVVLVPRPPLLTVPKPVSEPPGGGSSSPSFLKEWRQTVHHPVGSPMRLERDNGIKSQKGGLGMKEGGFLVRLWAAVPQGTGSPPRSLLRA